MNQLQIVTIKQAKKLKELRFDWIVNARYENEKFCDNVLDSNHNGKTYISVPTTALALKWLRDEKDTIVDMGLLSKKNGVKNYFYSIYAISSKENFNSYEEAESAGLDYALDYLLKEMTDKRPEIDEAFNGDKV